ncbi:MAG: holo-ACP synthase [Clostridia bacterium]|nr:holo-ACP synthase [Clostridia bacterium]
MRVGIDSVLVKRFAKMKNFESFLTKYFSEYEISYVMGKNVTKFETIAGIFAAKEAFLKALKIGIGAGISLKLIEVNHNNNGAPYINLDNGLADKLIDHKIEEISISITHTKKTATAICIIN